MGCETLVVSHNAGFFSCYTIRLLNILSYFNKNKKCPDKVDSSMQFMDYKNDSPSGVYARQSLAYNGHSPLYASGYRTQDYTFEYIKLNDSLTIEYNKNTQITSENREEQFSNYKNINFQEIKPFIDKYFSPSDSILKIVFDLEKKYRLDYSNLACFYYRGTDKVVETNLCDFDVYIQKAIQIKKENPNIDILITSDEINIINLFKEYFPNVIVFEELLNNMSRTFLHSQLFLAMVLIMSKTNHLICSSSNVSLWMVLFRGHYKNIHQYLDPKEYIYGEKNNSFDSSKNIFWI